jgi:hypothetical protein
MGGVGEVVVFIEVKITGMSESEGYGGLPLLSKHQCVFLLMGDWSGVRVSST